MGQTFYFLKVSSTTKIEDVVELLESPGVDAPADWKGTQERLTQALLAVEPGLYVLYDELTDDATGIQIVFHLDGTASMNLSGWPMPDIALKKARAYVDVFEQDGFTLCDVENEFLYAKGQEFMLVQPPTIETILTKTKRGCKLAPPEKWE